MFLANYADVLTDAPLDTMIERFAASDAVGGVAGGAAAVGVPLRRTWARATSRLDHHVQEMPLWENGGYFVFRPEIFEHIEEDCDLIGDVCAPLAKDGRMMAYRHRGFWQPADTVKERTALEAAYQSGDQTVDAVGAPGRCRPRSQLPGGSTAEDRRTVLSLLPSGSIACCCAAHCDDIAIGAGGTLLELCRSHPGVAVDGARAHRRRLAARGGGARRARGVLPGRELDVAVLDLPDGRVPTRWERAKLALEELRTRGEPDLIFAPSPHDAHQDHRTLAELGAHGVPRPPDPRLRDPQVGRRPRPAHRVPPARRAGAPGEDRQAARALRLAARPQLVRPRGVRRPRPGPRRAVPRPLRRGLPRREMVWGGAAARRRPATASS